MPSGRFAPEHQANIGIRAGMRLPAEQTTTPLPLIGSNPNHRHHHTDCTYGRRSSPVPQGDYFLLSDTP